MKYLKPFNENKIEVDLRNCFDNLKDDFGLEVSVSNFTSGGYKLTNVRIWKNQPNSRDGYSSGSFFTSKEMRNEIISSIGRASDWGYRFNYTRLEVDKWSYGKKRNLQINNINDLLNVKKRFISCIEINFTKI